MINSDFREKYKVNIEDNRKSNSISKTEISNTEKSYNEQIELRDEENYEQMADNAFLQILDLFSKRYKGVKIDCPIGRAKSNKSLKGKVEKLEIERLCTIYEINNLTNEEKDILYKLIIGKVDKELLHKKIKKVMYEKIDDLKLLEGIIKEKDLNDNVKMALLRIARIKLEKEEKDEVKKSELIQSLEYNYGEEAANRTRKLANNLMHWENIESVKNAYERIKNNNEKQGDKELIEKLYNPDKYLKVKDLRGFRLVVASIPDDLETDNNFLKGIIERRKIMPATETTRYNDLSCIEVEKDFASFLENNEDILKKMNLKLMSRKEKSKQNGYIADHLKFCSLDNEAYSFEIQIRSLYRDDMARGDGPAGHKNRAGKKRTSLNTSSPEEFMKQTYEEVPKYTRYKNNEGKFTINKCSMIENIMVFYFNFLDMNSKEFKKAIEYSNNKKVIDYWDKTKGEER